MVLLKLEIAGRSRDVSMVNPEGSKTRGEDKTHTTGDCENAEFGYSGSQVAEAAADGVKERKGVPIPGVAGSCCVSMWRSERERLAHSCGWRWYAAGGGFCFLSFG